MIVSDVLSNRFLTAWPCPPRRSRSCRWGQHLLDETVANLGKESKVAGGAMAALSLPLMSVSDENLKTRGEYDQLNTKLNRMVAGGTFALIRNYSGALVDYVCIAVSLLATMYRPSEGRMFL